VPLASKVTIHSLKGRFGCQCGGSLTFRSLSSAHFSPFVHIIETTNLPERSDLSASLPLMALFAARREIIRPYGLGNDYDAL
jgi:hypothetical protein